MGQLDVPFANLRSVAPDPDTHFANLRSVALDPDAHFANLRSDTHNTLTIYTPCDLFA